jgi:hypothetical protein
LLSVVIEMRELVHTVLEHTVAEADRDARQREEVEADMENVLRWIACMGSGIRRGQRSPDTITLDLRHT